MSKPAFSIDALARAPGVAREPAPLPPKPKPPEKPKRARKATAPKPPRPPIVPRPAALPPRPKSAPREISELDRRAQDVAARSKATKLLQIKLPLEIYREIVELCEARDLTVAHAVRYCTSMGLRAIASGADAPTDLGTFGVAQDAGFITPMNSLRELSENRRWNEHGFSSIASENYRDAMLREQAAQEAAPVRRVASAMAESLRGMMPASAPPPGMARYQPPPAAYEPPSFAVPQATAVEPPAQQEPTATEVPVDAEGS